MKTMNDYLDMGKVICKTDSELARAIGRTYREVWAYRKGKKTPDVTTSTKLALLIGVEPIEIIACIEALSAKDDDKKEFWTGFLLQHKLLTITALSLILSASYGIEDTDAAGVQASVASHHPTTISPHYAQYWKRLRSLFAGLSGIQRFYHGFALWLESLQGHAQARYQTYP